LMGEGLVRSVDNFGTTGDAPSHPELLDHLAARFIREGWSIKKLVREIVMSRTYRQSSRGTRTAIAADPENHLYSRANHRRFTAEEIRDTVLTVSGQLKLEIGGLTFPQDRAADYGFEYTDTRRSVYVPVFRNALPEMFEAFDFAPPTMVVGKRSNSTVPTQALFLLNHPFVREQAKAAAAQWKNDADPITSAYWLALGRPPTVPEREIATKHLTGAGDGMTDLFHALFASVEFRYVE
jgi:hypothetical protein